ncbi:MAG: hypothetical protein QOJ27_2603 [Sphingomonadales bacterium]|nr:hypothetical protein [Sphingomonadales bacterium]
MSLALLLAAWLAPAPAAAGTASVFVGRLYAAYRDENYSPLRHPGRVFDRPFAAALAEDKRLYRGEVGFIDADPLCQCQDPAGMKAELGDARLVSPRRAEVPVRLRFGAADVRDLKLKLSRTSAGWRIADIATPDEPSFLHDLAASNRSKRSGGAR